MAEMTMEQKAALRNMTNPGSFNGFWDIHQSITAIKFNGYFYAESVNGIPQEPVLMPQKPKGYESSDLQKLERELSQQKANLERYSAELEILDAKRHHADADVKFKAIEDCTKRIQKIEKEISDLKNDAPIVFDNYIRELQNFIQEVEGKIIQPAKNAISELSVKSKKVKEGV